MSDTQLMTTVEALDAAFAGESCELVGTDGVHRTLATHRWSGAASPSDLALFVDRCTGPTLDLGCGPGRLAGALWHRGVDVLGVDISPEAVRQTIARGAPAVCRDVFAELPLWAPWEHVLLADGNIGLGGHPVRLLQRVAALLGPRGTVLVELAGVGAVSIHRGVRLRVGERDSRSFDWATVGVNAIADLSVAAGLSLVDLTDMAGRFVATLRAPVGAVTPGERPA